MYSSHLRLLCIHLLLFESALLLYHQLATDNDAKTTKIRVINGAPREVKRRNLTCLISFVRDGRDI